MLLAGLTACTPQPIVALPSTTASAIGKPLVIGTAGTPDGSNSMENDIVAHIYSTALNAAGIETIVRPEDDGDPTLIDKLKDGSVDIVPEYSATLLYSLDPGSQAATPTQIQAAIMTLLPAGLAITEPSNAQDDDSIAVTQMTAQKYNLKTLADLAKVCDQIVFGGTKNFLDKPRGLPALQAVYGCVPKSYSELSNDKDALVLALLRNGVQAADVHSTSPAIDDNDLVVLTDTKNAFLPDQLVPVVASAHVPEAVQSVLNKVSAQLTSTDLTTLNTLARGPNHPSIPEIASDWLVGAGLIKATS